MFALKTYISGWYVIAGEISALVSPAYAGEALTKWHEIGKTLASLLMEEFDSEIPSVPLSGNLSRLAAILLPALPRLLQSYSHGNYAPTTSKVQRIAGASWKELQGRFSAKQSS